MKYQAYLNSVAKGNSTHKWVSEAVIKLDDHDVVDVLNDLDILKSVFQMKLNELTHRHV